MKSFASLTMKSVWARMKSALQMKWNPPFRRRGGFHLAGVFIIEDDFTHPQGWISMKKRPVETGRFFWSCQQIWLHLKDAYIQWNPSLRSRWNPCDHGWNLLCRWNEIHPSAVEADFISAGDFIIEDDFTHPPGWISTKKRPVETGRFFWSC